MTRLKLASALALAALCLCGVLPSDPATAQPAPSGDRFEGFLTALWADPHPNSTAASETRFTLTYPNGSRARVNVGPALRSEALRLAGKRVTVRGAASGELSSQSISADAIEATGFETQAAATGVKKVLFILLKFKDDPQTPHAPDFFKKLTNPLAASAGIPATINGFFDKTSYGVFKWSGAVAGDKWYTLPRNRSAYAPCGAQSVCANLGLLGDDAVQLVRGDADITEFDNINFVVNDDLDCCAWGGGYSNGVRVWGATYEPPWAQETSTYVHEMGHSLGLPHSGWRYEAYDSGHDEMSRGTRAKIVQCGTYDSSNFGGPNTPINCSEPGGGYIMAHQDFLGWIPAARKAVHSAKTTKTYVVEANASPLSSKLKLVVICLKGKPCSSSQPSGRFLTVEVKTRTAKFDGAVPSEGVVIHEVMMDRPDTPASIAGTCYFNNSSGWAMPFDATPGDWNASSCSGAGLSNLAYGVGQTFKSKSLGVKVEVLKKTGETFTVKVTKSK